MSNDIGRPTVFTEIALQKLEQAFAIGCTDEEACLYADIATSSLYNYQKEHPDFLERKDILKQRPVLQSRQVLVNAIIGEKRKVRDKEGKVLKNPDGSDKEEWEVRPNASFALAYLERKKKEEFGQKIGLEVSRVDEEWIKNMEVLRELVKNKQNDGGRKIEDVDKNLLP
jgi:hypothetical protein